MTHLANYRASLEPGSGFIDDLASLTTLDEQRLLKEIQIRYDNNIIYTYIGDILVALNPYKQVHIFGPETQKRYKNVTILKSLPPHIYALTDRSYTNMRSTGRPQCCVVSGESGAGKTETTKLMVEHLITLCRHGDSDLHERIIQVNPMLEAFGNAQTIINDNSSRFGKYIELVFNNDGNLLGGQISEYLLEKSRVVSQAPGEQNFHIFYYMFAGLTDEQLTINRLNKPESHRILCKANKLPVFTSEAQFLYCQEKWNQLIQLMAVVGISEEVEYILALLAAVLHITDIEFEKDRETDGVFIKYEEMMEIAAELLVVNPQELAAAFISNVTYLKGERIVSLKNLSLANDGRDALAKALYGRLFGWIVRQINLILQPDLRVSMNTSIGILDIAGFENFPVNSFEQLCINVANEQLQFYFNQHIFQWELDEYKKEGIKAKDVKYIDNKGMIELFLESHTGLFSLLDEESKFPQATDSTLLDKLSKNFSKRSAFTKAKGRDLSFTITHYAGQVVYRVEGFLEKNRDTLSMNLTECMRNSESQMVCDLFTANLSDIGSLMSNPNMPKRTRKSVLLCKDRDFTYDRTKSLSKRASRAIMKDNAKQKNKSHLKPQNASLVPHAKSLGAHFRNSLTHLMRKLLDAEPSFIRCIKPNSHKEPGLFMTDLIARQLKYTGILETVRIRKMGYPTRIPHQMFIERYKILVFPFVAQVDITAANCLKILKNLNLQDYAIGKTKIFLRYWHLEHLNYLMNQYGWKIVKAQSCVRAFLAGRRFRSLLQLSYQDRAAVNGFCVYLQKESDDKLYHLSQQQSYDAERFQQEYAKKQANRLKMLSPTPLVQASQDLLKKSAPPTALKPRIPPSPSDGPRQPMRRPSVSRAQRKSSLVNQYQTETLINSSKKLSIDVDATSNYARPAQIPGTPPPISLSNNIFYMSILEESIDRLLSLDGDVWGKLYYMEQDDNCAKLYLRHSQILIDNKSDPYDGQCVGISAFENPDRNKDAKEIISKIGEGLRIWRDFSGNIFAERLCDSCDFIVKGFQDPINYCVAAEMSELYGRIPKAPTKIYDIDLFKQHIAYAIQKRHLDEVALQRLGIVSISFSRNTLDDHKTPCWISILNFCAFDMLGNRYVLEDMIKNYNMKFNTNEDIALKRSWCTLKHRNENDNCLQAVNFVNTCLAERNSYSNNSNNNNSLQRGPSVNNVGGRAMERSESPSYANSIHFQQADDSRTLLPRK